MNLEENSSVDAHDQITPTPSPTVDTADVHKILKVVGDKGALELMQGLSHERHFAIGRAIGRTEARSNSWHLGGGILIGAALSIGISHYSDTILQIINSRPDVIAEPLPTAPPTSTPAPKPIHEIIISDSLPNNNDALRCRDIAQGLRFKDNKFLERIQREKAIGCLGSIEDGSIDLDETLKRCNKTPAKAALETAIRDLRDKYPPCTSGKK